jgi:hypothetical protein
VFDARIGQRVAGTTRFDNAVRGDGIIAQGPCCHKTTVDSHPTPKPFDPAKFFQCGCCTKISLRKQNTAPETLQMMYLVARKSLA